MRSVKWEKEESNRESRTEGNFTRVCEWVTLLSSQALERETRRESAVGTVLSLDAGPEDFVCCAGRRYRG